MPAAAEAVHPVVDSSSTNPPHGSSRKSLSPQADKHNSRINDSLDLSSLFDWLTETSDDCSTRSEKQLSIESVRQTPLSYGGKSAGSVESGVLQNKFTCVPEILQTQSIQLGKGNNLADGTNWHPAGHVVEEQRTPSTSLQDPKRVAWSKFQQASKRVASGKFSTEQKGQCPVTPSPVTRHSTASSSDSTGGSRLSHEPSSAIHHTASTEQNPIRFFSKQEWRRLEKLQKEVLELWHEAHQERESARSWAAAMRSSVRRWVNEQRALVECERRNDVASHREALTIERRKTGALERDAEDFAGANDTESGQECNLQDLIRSQSNKIEELEERIRKLEGKQQDAATSTTVEECVHNCGVGPSSHARVSLSPETGEKRLTTPANSVTMNISIASKASSTSEGKSRYVRDDGTTSTTYSNGAEKETRLDGSILTRYPNGDYKQVTPEGIICYYHAAEKTLHTRQLDGTDVYKYPNEQVERHYPNGGKEITFPDGTKKRILSDGSTETAFSDGVHVVLRPNGTKEITRLS